VYDTGAAPAARAAEFTDTCATTIAPTIRAPGKAQFLMCIWRLYFATEAQRKARHRDTEYGHRDTEKRGMTCRRAFGSADDADSANSCAQIRALQGRPARSPALRGHPRRLPSLRLCDRSPCLCDRSQCLYGSCALCSYTITFTPSSSSFGYRWSTFSRVTI
jgi:hypothetical protein